MVNKPQKPAKRRKLRAVIHPDWQLWMDESGQSVDRACVLFNISRRRVIHLMQRDPDQLTRLGMSAVYHRLDPWV